MIFKKLKKINGESRERKQIMEENVDCERNELYSTTGFGKKETVFLKDIRVQISGARS